MATPSLGRTRSSDTTHVSLSLCHRVSFLSPGRRDPGGDRCERSCRRDNPGARHSTDRYPSSYNGRYPGFGHPCGGESFEEDEALLTELFGEIVSKFATGRQIDTAVATNLMGLFINLFRRFSSAGYVSEMPLRLRTS